ncbi:MAG TPA: hypothetical protein PKA48_04595, partial [Candidatus Obscuribacter sp.]|nr:hypothetical protein [Candidatus Obscuribacter sp.]
GLSSPRSMILDLLEEGFGKPVTLCYGARNRAELYYHDSFLALAGIIAPYMTGLLVEKTKSFNSPFMLLIFFTLAGVLAVAVMQNPDRDRKLKVS